MWNEAASRIEMHLESLGDQAVRIDGARRSACGFARGERIHTESSVKYDDAMIASLFASTGFAKERAFTDDARSFAVYLARAV